MSVLRRHPPRAGAGGAPRTAGGAPGGRGEPLAVPDPASATAFMTDIAMLEPAS